MKPLIIIYLLFIAAMCSCSPRDGADCGHIECNGVYYWKTVMQLDPGERDFMKRHRVGRIYLRMFDVKADARGYSRGTFERVAPNASMRIAKGDRRTTVDSLNSRLVVPVVYVTLEALSTAKGQEGELAALIVERVRRMCSYNELISVEGLQLDCDWTPSTEQSYFALCDSARAQIALKDLHWSLSSTIRLHQLSHKAPPVDYGVLMVYNTGNFSDPNAKNSIIDLSDVEQYLGYLDDYPLHLDVAYPTYSWQLLFRRMKFLGLMNGVNVADTTRFAPLGDHSHRALCDVIHKGKIIYKGDIVRTEKSTPSEVRAVKEAIESHLHDRPHSNILYHLDYQNLSEYSADEINSIYSAGKRD